MYGNVHSAVAVNNRVAPDSVILSMPSVFRGEAEALFAADTRRRARRSQTMRLVTYVAAPMIDLSNVRAPIE
jgi:hypothetical protein